MEITITIKGTRKILTVVNDETVWLQTHAGSLGKIIQDMVQKVVDAERQSPSRREGKQND